MCLCLGSRLSIIAGRATGEIVKILSLLPILALSLSNASPVSDDGFMAYWAKFRAAVLRDDMATLATLTRFPLQAGSDNDQDHPRSITRAQFPAYFRVELRCPALDHGSNFDMVRRRAGKLDPNYDYHKSGHATVGSLDFLKIAGQWRLATLDYGAVEEYYDRLKGRCS